MYKIKDGNTACADVAYKFSEMSFIYPITPSSPMAARIDELKNKNEIIEIQTQNIGKLKTKIEYAIKNNLKIKIVIPIITKKNIITTNNNEIISKRISPKKENIYNLFKKIIGIHSFLSKENLTLEILFLEITEHRIKLKEKTQFIVATESGILHQMKKDYPEKTFIPVPPETGNCACNECNYMRMNTMEKLYNCLKNETPEIIVDKEVAEKAVKPIIKMLEMSK